MLKTHPRLTYQGLDKLGRDERYVHKPYPRPEGELTPSQERAYHRRRIGRFQVSKGEGETTLLAHILAQAVKDYHGIELHHRLDAIAFFHSAWYREILCWLGLPTDWLPDGVEI